MALPVKENDDVDKSLARTQSFTSDLVEDTVVQDFGYEPTYSRIFSSIGSMSLTLAMAS